MGGVVSGELGWLGDEYGLWIDKSERIMIRTMLTINTHTSVTPTYVGQRWGLIWRMGLPLYKKIPNLLSSKWPILTKLVYVCMYLVSSAVAAVRRAQVHQDLTILVLLSWPLPLGLASYHMIVVYLNEHTHTHTCHVQMNHYTITHVHALEYSR